MLWRLNLAGAMQHPFTLYVDRLKSGDALQIREAVPSDFLAIRENDLSFPHPVDVTGEAYLADDHLIIHLQIRTAARLPCSICNQPVECPLLVEDFYHAEPLAEIPSALFDYTELVREAILLQVPAFAECRQGNCPERTVIKKFLTSTEAPPSSPDSHFPFAHLSH